MWRGTLYKSEVPVGTVCCVEAAGGARQTGSASEPHAWPSALHINHRISVEDALEHYAAAAPHARAVRVLLPQESPAGNVQAIQTFVQYLTSKGRAGMVKLPAANGASPRSLYLIVPRPHVCQSLQVAWDGRCVMLIVVVVPQGPGRVAAAAAAAGARGPRARCLGPLAGVVVVDTTTTLAVAWGTGRPGEGCACVFVYVQARVVSVGCCWVVVGLCM